MNPNGAFPSRSAALVPLAVIATGLVLSLALQLVVREPVFYSGDGGVKFLLTRQIASGRWSPDLALPAEPWVRELWDRGYYPLRPPFVYESGGRYVAGQPIAFPAASAPFWRLLGYRGLYVLPWLSLAAIAVRMHRLSRRFGLDASAESLAQSGWLLASFLPLHAAMFWEHLPATALAFLGLATLVEAMRYPVGAPRAVASGIGLGLGAWLRPEILVLAAAALVVSAPVLARGRRLRTWLGVAAGVGLAVAPFAAANRALYGRPLGMHALQVLERAGPLATRLDAAGHRAVVLVGMLFVYAPIVVAAVALAAVGHRDRPAGAVPIVRRVALVALLFACSTALVVPNLGGLQWGPRYLMPVVPLAAWAAGLGWDETVRRGSRRIRIVAASVAAVLLAWGFGLNAVAGVGNLRRNYARRVLPAVELVSSSGVVPVVVNDQHVAQEMAALMDDRRFFLLPEDDRPGERLAELADAFHRAGRERFLMIAALYGGDAAGFPPEIELHGALARSTGRLLGRYGDFYWIYRFETSPAGGGRPFRR